MLKKHGNYIFTKSIKYILICVDWKKVHYLKVENYVSLGRISEDLNPEGSLSDRSEGVLQRGKGGAKMHRSFCNKNR